VPNLQSMIGTMIWASIPKWGKEPTKEYKLHGVETSGLWLESQSLTEAVLGKRAAAETTTVLFVPFCQIDFVVGEVEQPALSEKSFGL